MFGKLSEFKFVIGAVITAFCISGCNVNPEEGELKKFNFNKYMDMAPEKYDKETLVEALREAFPVGASKLTIDEIMLRSGVEIDAGDRLDPKKACVTYYRHPKRFLIDMEGGRATRFIYDQQDRLINIHTMGGQTAYPDQPTFLELYEKGMCL